MYLITVCVCVCVCEKDCLCLRVWHMDLIIVRVYMCACVTYAGPVMPDRIQEPAQLTSCAYCLHMVTDGLGQVLKQKCAM